MLSTKMLSLADVLMPIYLLAKQFGLFDLWLALIIVYILINLLTVVWVVYTYFKDIPVDVFEAARPDDAGTWQEIVHVLLPITRSGLAPVLLLSPILRWNEAFWSPSLTSSAATLLTTLVASYSSSEGLFWAEPLAVSTLACTSILVFDWVGQKQLIRGLSLGATR